MKKLIERIKKFFADLSKPKWVWAVIQITNNGMNYISFHSTRKKAIKAYENMTPGRIIEEPKIVKVKVWE